MKKKEKEKSYKEPQILYEKQIETLAAVCDSSWVGPGGACCMKVACTKRAS